MSDFTLLDNRGRAAGAALREAAARRSVSQSPRTMSTAAGGRTARPGMLRPALIVAVLALLVVALVALVGRDPQPSQPTPKDLRYIVTGLDQTWTVGGARDGDGVDNEFLPGYRGTLYGTVGDPTRPGMLVTWIATGSADSPSYPGEGFANLIGSADLEQFEVNGLPAGCGDRATGETTCTIETEHGFVSTLSLGVAREDLRQMLTTLRHDGTTVTIDPASVPTSLSEVSSGSLSSVVRQADAYSAAASAVSWTNSDGSAVTVTVVRDDGTRLTRFAVEPGWEATTIGKVSGFRLNAAANTATLKWLHDGKLFTVEATLGLNQRGTAEDLARQFATSLRPARDSEWASLPPWKFDEVSPDTTAIVSPDSTNPQDSLPSSTTSVPTKPPVDIQVGLDTIGQFGGELTVRNTGPRVADDQYTIGFAIDTFRIRGDGGSGSFRMTSEPVLQIPPSTELRGAYVVTTVPGELVVIGQDGTRYHATPQAVFDGSDVRFAMINLPVNIAGAQLLAPDGSVLAELPGLS